MEPDLSERVLKALRQAARDARSADAQQEAHELVAILSPPTAPPEAAPEQPAQEPEREGKARKR